MMTLFAVRHKPSGLFLPGGTTRDNNSYVEPSATKPPRVFTKLAYAKTFCTYYVRGPWEKEYSQASDAWDGKEYLGNKPTHKRNPDDYEIVELELIEKGVI